MELTEEREEYIRQKHSDVLADELRFLRQTLLEPDLVVRDPRFSGTRVVSRWYDDLKGGKHAAVVVVSDVEPERHWIVTAFVARRVRERGAEWRKA